MGKVIDNVVWYSPEVLVYGVVVLLVLVLVLQVFKKDRPTKYKVDR